MRSKDEIEDQIAEAVDSKEESPSGKFPGMNYEDGVQAALMWAIEERDEAPMED